MATDIKQTAADLLADLRYQPRKPVQPPTEPEEEPVRDDSQINMLGAAAAILRYVHSCDPEYVIPQERINSLFTAMAQWGHRTTVQFPCYFTAQAGRFLGDRLFIRCDDKEQSVYVLEDGSEEPAGGCCRFGACVTMMMHGSWQEISEADALKMLAEHLQGFRSL